MEERNAGDVVIRIQHHKGDNGHTIEPVVPSGQRVLPKPWLRNGGARLQGNRPGC